jgi:SnoaL-like domain
MKLRAMLGRTRLAAGCALGIVWLSGGAIAANDAPRGVGIALSELRTLEQRTTRIEDINAIKRLQRAYGYYIDEGMWDEVVDLFTNDATLEIGLDGQYRGRERIREYLYTLGGGRKGLAPGQLNEHLQLMPVVTVHSDGLHAKGTWRAVILAGQLGKEARWGEGPYENEYVKEHGVWKLARLHWFQTLLVPYKGGWEKNADVNGTRFVSDKLAPDAPPTMQYKSWPGAYTPPFHFRGQYPGLLPITASPAATGETRRASTTAVRQLANRVQRLADQDAIENLQRSYGFYIDKGLWSEAAALFTDDAELEIQGRGVFRGQARVLEYLRAIGPEGLQAGRLMDHMQLQPITHLAKDGKTARGRWHWFAQLAQHGQFHEWATGVYENQYRHEQGRWKISRLHLYPTMITPYESGWGVTSLPQSRFEPTLAPDAPSKGRASTYDHVFVAPMHYEHPVRAANGKVTAQLLGSSNSRAPSATEIERQLTQVEDRASIENVQTAYGYYLATLLWDDLAALFTEDGTIEIAMRGIYSGRPAVRRNLNLYGQAGLDDGVLHNHMQYQMVIHVDADGRGAKLRSRALSMMGNFNRSAMWMGGMYENEFVKLDGQWKFKKDQQVNTYFAPFDTGWKDLGQRPPPGITASNPPDLPPSFAFDLYPKNFLLPFHYNNPVTDKPYVAR